eukprot:243795_1
MINYFISENTKIGLIVTGFGVFFLSLGCAMFFDAALLALGNIEVFVGLVITMGPRNMTSLFLSKSKLFGTVCFFFGIYLVLTGWARIGIIIEFFGIINLFKNFFPMFLIEWIPVIGPLISRLRR